MRFPIVRRTVLYLCIFLAFAAAVDAKEKKIHGYVTNLISPAAFEIEDYRITRDQSLVLEFEKGEDNEPIKFNPSDIRIGTELEVKGNYNETTGELHATSVKVFLQDYKKIKRTTLLERQPQLKQVSDGWEGTISGDGEQIHIQTSTTVVFKPNKSEKKARKQHKKQEQRTKDKNGGASSLAEQEESAQTEPLQSLAEIGPNTFMSYEGYRQPDGIITASRVQFERSELEPGEAKLWKRLDPKVKEPEYTRGKPGELRIREIGKFKITPSLETQRYVQRVGESVVPEFQRNLPDADSNKIHFRFYVVDAKPANAFALANGVVVVFSSMFDVLENEAQLASVLGHEITHSVEKHTRRELEYHRKKLIALRLGGAVAAGFGAYGIRDLTNLIEAAVRNGYSRSLENQADREGLQDMVEAGYDPREAPRVWKQMTKKYGDHPTNFFWSNHDSNTLRRSYLMAELRNNYSGLDYAALKVNEQDFQAAAHAVGEVSSNKKKVKVKY